MKDIIFTQNPSMFHKKGAKIIYIGNIKNKLDLCNKIVAGLNYPYDVHDNWDALIDCFRSPDEGTVNEKEIVLIHDNLSILQQLDFENYIDVVQIVASEWIDDPEHHYTFVFNKIEQDKIEPLLRLRPLVWCFDINNYEVENSYMIDFPNTSNTTNLFLQLSFLLFQPITSWKKLKKVYDQLAKIKDKDIVIKHKDISHLSKDDFSQYMDIVHSYTKNWMMDKTKKHVIQFAFDYKNRDLISIY